MTDEDVPAFLRAFREIAEMAHRVVGDGDGERFADVVGEHLGGPAGAFAVVTEEVMNHRYADWDTALALLASRDADARELGIGGGDMRYHQTLTDFVAGTHGRFPVG